MPVDLKTAMVLAAGLGTRMRPLTDDRPKPMVEVGGKVLIDWALDDIAQSGIETAVVNLHYKAEVLQTHLARRTEPKITLSDEADLLLDTGGGVAAALPLIDGDVFLVTNSDALWHDGLMPAIAALKEAWTNDMDALLLLADMDRAHGFDGTGDFFLDDDRTPRRRAESPTAPLAYSGTQLVHRRLFKNHPGGAFSFNALWDKSISAQTLKAIAHQDDWYHVGTPDAVGPTADALSQRSGTS